MKSKTDHRAKARRIFWNEHNRHEYACPDCGRGEEELRNHFEVHHIDGDCTNHDLDNLVGLCRPCHNLREGKKPSLNEYRYLLDQFSNEERSDIPLITSVEEENEHFDRCDEQSIPVLELIQKRRRKYAAVQIEFITTGGWKVFEAVDTTDDAPEDRSHEDIPPRRPHAQLTKRATQRVNSIVARYKDKQQPTNHNIAPMMNYGVDYTRFPPLLPNIAKQLAHDLKPVIMDRSNWEPIGLPTSYVWEPVYRDWESEESV
jgi:hypothetical protein